MKPETLISNLNIKKPGLLQEGMTENSKNACKLLLSVILLTGTVTGVAGPLRNSELRLAEESRYMQKEIRLYREFAGAPARQENRLRLQIERQLLQAKLPQRIDAEQFVSMIYRKAGTCGIRIQKIKQVPEKAGIKKADKNIPRRLIWNIEFSGGWNALTAFLEEIEKQEPLTRLGRAEIIRSQRTGELSVQADLHAYYSGDQTDISQSIIQKNTSDSSRKVK